MRIPNDYRDEFIGWMDAHKFDDMSDVAQWATLEQAAEEFIERYSLRADPHDAMIWYMERAK